jgi:hypothetical protein
MKPLVLSIAALLVSVAHPRAAERPIVVELFTSQGCSSCPPADSYLTEIASSRPNVLPLAFHVTYWNGLGWRDPFSLDSATRRQAAYEARFGDGSYTPELVVDGRKGVVGSQRDDVEDAIAWARRTAVTATTLSAVRAGDAIEIHVGGGRAQGRLVLVGYDRLHQTSVGRGENSGRTLTESNIVRSIVPVAPWTGVPLSLTVAAPDGEAAAVLLEAENGTIIGAARVGT